MASIPRARPEPSRRARRTLSIHELARLGNYYTDYDHPLFDIRDRIDTLARKAAHFFRVDLQ